MGLFSKRDAAVSSTIDYDEVLKHIGQCGTWQLRNFFLLWLTSAAGGLAVVVWAFTALTPAARCPIPYCGETGSSPLYNATSMPQSYPDYFKEAMPSAGGSSCSYPVVAGLTDGTNCGTYLAKIDKVRKEAIENGVSPVFEYETCDRQTELIVDTSVVTSSLTRDYDFLCNKEVLYKGVLGAMYMIGMLLGSFFIGLFSDAFGRMKALMLSVVLCSVSGFIGAFVHDPVLFGFLRIITGMGGIGFFMVTFVLAVEYIGAKYTMLFGIAIEIPFALGELLLGLEAYYVRDWRMLQIVAYAPLLVLLILWFMVPESPRWLLAKGRREEAVAMIRKAADINGKTIPEEVLQEKEIPDGKMESEELEVVIHSKQATILDIFRPKDIAFRSLNMFYQWFSVTMCYYGLSFASTSLAGSVYTNYTLAILVEFPGYFFCIFAMDVWGRRPILSFCQLISGVSCILAGAITGVESLATVQIILTLIGKFGASACFAIVYVYTAELFPTIIRNTAIGSCSTMARVGGVCALLLVNVQGRLPFIIMGAVAVVAGCLAFLFPETVGQPLPETVYEARNIGKGANKRGFCTCICPKDLKSHFKE